MMTTDGFDSLAERIAQVNDLPLELARQYLSFIGDTPELADDGKVIVSDEDGTELARITLPASSPA